MTNGLKFALGISGLAIVVVAAGIFLLRGDDEKELTLELKDGNCTVTASANGKDFRVKKGHKVSYKIKNTCGSGQLVVVGNFRPENAGDGGITDCKAGKTESVWPFKESEQSMRQKYLLSGETQNLVLKEAKNDGVVQARFRFDICMAGKKVDPRLDVDP